MTTALIAATTASADSNDLSPSSPLAGTQVATVNLMTAANLSTEIELSIARPASSRTALGTITAARSNAASVAHSSPVAESSSVESAVEDAAEQAPPAEETPAVAEATAEPEPAPEAEAAVATEAAASDEQPAAAAEEPAATEEPAAEEAATEEAAAETPEPDTTTQEAPAAQQTPSGPPNITFPVVGPVSYVDTWGACRGSGCSRSHKGVDIFGHKLAPLVAAADGVISADRRSAMSISGNTVIVTGDNGWRYLYIHLNNDAPGTDDGSNPQAWIIPNRLKVGDRVEAGDVIGYLGDSGNAETTPAHVHFEIHEPGVGAVNPTPFVDQAVDAGRVVGVPGLASSPEGRAEHTPTIVAWYQALLKRDPTDSELFAWADRMDIDFANTNDLIADLTMDKARRDPAGAIVRSFEVALNRRPTLNELRLWEEAYRNGTTLQSVGSTLIDSAPFEQQHGALSDEDFIKAVYQNAIGANPSEKRLADWLEAINVDGTPRAAVVASLADSYSVKNSTWHGLEVIQSYRAGLDRMPTVEEYDLWVAHLDAGGLIPEVVEAIRTAE